MTSRLEVEAFDNVACPPTLRVPVASRLEEVAEARVDWPVAVNVPTVRFPDPVALVKVRPVIVELFTYSWLDDVIERFCSTAFPPMVENISVPLLFSAPALAAPVKTSAFAAQGVEVESVPLPAVVEVTYLLPPASKRFPATNTVPVAETLNWLEEFTCRSRKLPLKVAGLEPMKVPVVDPPWMMLGPSWKRDEEARSCGVPESRKARAPVWEDWM